MRIPHRAPFSNSLRALSVVAGSASEWLVVLIVPWEKDANPHETRFQVNMGLDSLKATLVTILNTLALTPPATHCLQNERACLELVRKMLTRWRYIWWVRQRVWRVDRWGIFITLKDFFFMDSNVRRKCLACGNASLESDMTLGFFVYYETLILTTCRLRQ